MKTKKSHHNTKQDLLVLVAAPILAAIASWVLRLDFLLSTVLYFGAPALYLSVRDTSKIKRTAIFAACFSIVGVYVDYMAERDLAWVEPKSLLHFRFGGLVPIESLVWFFLLTYLIAIFYEYFFDQLSHKPIGHRMKYLFFIVAIASTAFFLSLLTRNEIPRVSYFYLKMGIFLGALPLAAFIFELPRFLSIFLKTAPYFFALSLLGEFIGLHNGYWSFPGQHFIGWMQIGSFHFPYEEFIFWMVMFSSIVIVYFEIFDDNRLRFRLRR